MHGTELVDETMADGKNKSGSSSELNAVFQVMRLNPSRWTQLSVETILEDLEALDASQIPVEVRCRTQRIRRELIVPLAEMIINQPTTVGEEERQTSTEKAHQLEAALAALAAEKNKAVQLYQEEAVRLARHSQFCDMLLGDLDDMAKMLEMTRREKELAEQKLAAVEAQVKALVLENELRKATETETSRHVHTKTERSASREDVEWQTSGSHVLTVTAALKADKASEDVNKSDVQPERFKCHSRCFWTAEKKGSLLENVAIVVWEEAVSSLNTILDSGMKSSPNALLHFCKGLRQKAVIAISSAILTAVKHSPIGFAFQMY